MYYAVFSELCFVQDVSDLRINGVLDINVLFYTNHIFLKFYLWIVTIQLRELIFVEHTNQFKRLQPNYVTIIEFSNKCFNK